MFEVKTTLLRLYVKGTFCQCFKFSNLSKQYYLNNLSHLKFYQSVLKFRNFNNWRTLILSKLRKNTIEWQPISRQILSIKSNSFQFSRTKSNNVLKFNIKINNNVMLYRFEKPWLFKLILLFGVFAPIGCITMANNVYLVLCKDLFKEDVELKTRIYNHIFPIVIITFGLVSGPFITYFIWSLTVRSVKYLILHKGSEKVTIITYHPIRAETKVTVPIDEISCTTGRTERSNYVKLKLKNYKLPYMLDKTGNFVNPELFDAAIGISRFN